MLNEQLVNKSFVHVSFDQLKSLYDQKKGELYFIPDGFEPIIISNNSDNESVINILNNSKQRSKVPNVPKILNDTNVRIPSYALSLNVNLTNLKIKKPPRPPNAFILYRKSKQHEIISNHNGITNNEVSKKIGKMWHNEHDKIRQKFVVMADLAKKEHLKKYPNYKYSPRKTNEIKRRVKRNKRNNTRDDCLSQNNLSKNNNDTSDIFNDLLYSNLNNFVTFEQLNTLPSETYNDNNLSYLDFNEIFNYNLYENINSFPYEFDNINRYKI